MKYIIIHEERFKSKRTGKMATFQSFFQELAFGGACRCYTSKATDAKVFESKEAAGKFIKGWTGKFRIQKVYR
jgi:hypothetical protein